MAADVVLLRDSAYNLRLFAGNPADYEESGPGIGFLENPEYAVHVSMNTHRVMFPLFGRVCGRVVEQVEPLLDIKSKNVHRIGLMGWTIRQITGIRESQTVRTISFIFMSEAADMHDNIRSCPSGLIIGPVILLNLL